jgi:hypothetical protein
MKPLKKSNKLLRHLVKIQLFLPYREQTSTQKAFDASPYLTAQREDIRSGRLSLRDISINQRT